MIAQQIALARAAILAGDEPLEQLLLWLSDWECERDLEAEVGQ